MAYQSRNPIRRNLFSAVLLVLLSPQTMVFSQQSAKVIPYSSSDFQDHLKLSFSEVRSKCGASEWSALVQKKTSDKLHVLAVITKADQETVVYYRAYQSSGDGGMVLDAIDFGKDMPSRMLRWKAIDNNRKGLSKLLAKLRETRVSLLNRVPEHLDADYYSIDVVNPPVSISMKFNSIDPHDASMALLLDHIVSIAPQ